MDSIIYESGLFIPEPAGEFELEPCPICKRTFVPATLEKHIGICQKMQTRKRNIFDSSQKRREGTELEKYMPPPQNLSTSSWFENRYSPPKQTPKMVRRFLETASRRGSTSSQGTIGESTRKRSISKEPVSEQCPYCERSFGVKAYDRHVQWCKEKATLKSYESNKTQMDSVAKERLNARINYRAPSLRTKRGSTRDKYSPFDEVFMRSLSLNKNKCRSELGGRSLSNSMTSSIISDGGFSDKYDPFMSAKRQLEELFSPTPVESKSIDKKPALKGVSLGGSGGKVKPLISASDSNFRRSMSLRLPKRTSPKPLPKVNKPSSVQSGITDDGPISANFVKPEVFDETPVRSVYTTVLRNPDSIPNRRNMKLNLVKVNLPALDFPISKTDSLATFLNYEQNLGLSEKDLKDSNNILNQTMGGMRVVDEVDDLSDYDDDKDEHVAAAAEEQETERKSSGKLQEAVVTSPTTTTEVQNAQQKPCMKVILSPIEISRNELRSCHDQEERKSSPGPDFIDPNLINDCDNLISPTNSSSEIAKPKEERDTTKWLSLGCWGPNRKLMRQMKLQLDNILYDTMPQTGSKQSDSMEKVTTDSGHKRNYFDQFDLEEFINSFEDDEQNPIFKGYKEMLQSNSKLEESSDPDEEGDFYPESESLEKDLDHRNRSGQTSPSNDELIFNTVDSSYGSLTRQSTPEKETPMAAGVSQQTKMSRFCYECGLEFVMDKAKFCMECGAKRV